MFVPGGIGAFASFARCGGAKAWVFGLVIGMILGAALMPLGLATAVILGFVAAALIPEPLPGIPIAVAFIVGVFGPPILAGIIAGRVTEQLLIGGAGYNACDAQLLRESTQSIDEHIRHRSTFPN